MPRSRRDELVLANLPNDVVAIFHEVQSSNMNHDKNCVKLYKLHDQAREITKETRGGGIKVVGERAFQKAFLACILQTLSVKKGDIYADRIARFTGTYLKFVNEKALEDHRGWAAEGLVDIEADHYGTRFTEGLLTELIPGFDAKDKTVRYRVLLVMSHMTKHLGFLNFKVHQMLKDGLVERTSDREPSIRSLAAISIAQVYANHVPEEDEDPDEHPGRDILLDMLPLEASSEVRKAILNNIKLDAVSIPHVVRQARDKDANIRKLVYGQVLKKGMFEEVDGSTEPGPSHPTVLPLSEMETIIKKGLRDREDGPRQAAASLVNEWVKTYERELPKPEPDQTYHAEVGVISLLERFNIIERRTEDLEVIEILLDSIFSSRKDIVDGLDFSDENWRRQGPENAMISRVFIQYCKKTKQEAKLEEILPVNRDMKDTLEGYYGVLIDAYDAREDTKVPIREIQAREFILGEMLKIAELLDYSERFGALRIMSLLKDSLLFDNRLPEHLLPLGLDVLRQVANDEHEYIRIIVQLIQDLRESEPPGLDEDAIAARCLKMCMHSLERVTSTYAENLTLRGIMEELVSPCTSHEDPDIQRDAVTCIAMCSLITKPMAAAALAGCLSTVRNPNTPPDTKVVLYKTMFDLLMTYGKRIFTLQADSPVTEDSLEEDLCDQLEREDDLSALTVLCEGIMKLILTDFINTPQVLLINLFKVFVWPQTQHHAKLLQRLQYFFEMYSVSSPKHQQMMQQIFVDVLKETAKEREKLLEDEELISSAKVCSAFERWTDPFELEKNMEAEGMDPSRDIKINWSVHLDLAHEILVALFEKAEKDRLQKDDKKALYQLLPRLHLPDDADGIKVVDLKLLMDTLKKCHPPTDTPSKNAFKKFESTFTELYAAQLESFSEEDYREYEALDELFKFLDDIIPDEDSMVDEDKPMTRGQKRRSRSSAASSTGVDDEDISSRSKRPRYSTAGTEERQSTRNGTPADHIAKVEPVDVVIPAKVSRPRTSGPPPPGAEVIEISSDEDDEPAPPPRPKPKPTARYRGPRATIVHEYDSIEQEEDIVDLSRRLSASASLSAGPSVYTTGTSANLTKDSLFSSVANTTRGNATKDSLFSSYTASANVNTTKDSLFDSDSEDEEDEVSGLVSL